MWKKVFARKKRTLSLPEIHLSAISFSLKSGTPGSLPPLGKMKRINM